MFNPEEDKPEFSHWNTFKTLGHYLWPRGRFDLRMRVIAAVLFLVGAKTVGVYVPFLLKKAIDGLSVKEGLITLPLGIILAYGFARILAAVFSELRDFVFVNVGQSAQRRIAMQTFEHLHRLSLDFHLARQTGGLSRVIERGTRGIQTVLRFMTFNVVPTLFEVTLVTGVIFFHFGFDFAGIIFTTIILYIVVTLAVTNWRTKYRKQMNAQESQANTRAIDSLLNFETVKYFGNEDYEYKRFDGSLARYESAAVKSQTGLSLLNLSQSMIIGLGLIAVMVLAGRGVVQGVLTLGDFVLVNTFLIQLYMPLNYLGFVYREIKDGLVDMDKMFELLHVQASVTDSHDAEELDLIEGTVEFKNVSFGYLKERTILKDLSFRVKPGQKLAIVGASGAGKSTISRLLFRFYDVGSGSIEIDGQEVKKFTQKSLRSHIGVVPQDTVLFNDTIGYNIRYGNPELDQHEVERAAKLAHIHEFIETLPLGYDTPVGERGLKISGGEKQRVAIARVILKRAKILLFDEATSSLDSHTEKEIQESLCEVAKDHTTIMIAHRLSTVIDADEIIVLKGGEAAERGKHAELLKRKGEYAEMWAKQQEARKYTEKLEALAEEKS